MMKILVKGKRSSLFSRNEEQKFYNVVARSAVAESLAEEEECPILTQFLAKLPVLPYNNNMRVSIFQGILTGWISTLYLLVLPSSDHVLLLLKILFS
jgi:hypothetical protein